MEVAAVAGRVVRAGRAAGRAARAARAAGATTGATGFKGAWLCSWLLKLGAKVYGIGFTPNKNKNLFYSLALDKKIVLKIFDIRELQKLTKFINSSKGNIRLIISPLLQKKDIKAIEIYISGRINSKFSIIYSEKNYYLYLNCTYLMHFQQSFLLNSLKALDKNQRKLLE